jgi:branched-chain amino acid transport system substrate-binding protein
MSLKKILTLLLMVLMGGMIFTGIAAAQEPVTLGIYEPLSGPSAYYGQTAVNGARMAVQEINEAGGVLGRQLILIEEDDAGDVTVTVSAVKKLILKDKVCAVIGDYYSSCTSAAMEVCEKYKVLDITGISTAPDITRRGNKWIFRTVATDAMNAVSYAKYMIEELGNETFVFMTNNEEFGRDGVKAYTPIVEGLGGKILETIFYSEQDTDFRTQITKIKGLNTDVIMLISEGAAGALFCKQAKELGEDATIMGVGTQAQDEFIRTAGSGAEGVYCATSYVASIDTPENEVFVKKYRELFKEDPTEYSLADYRNVYVLKQAIERAGTDDPVAIRDALTKTDYMDISGPIRFDESNQAYPWVFITKIVNGKLTIAKKAEASKVD